MAATSNEAVSLAGVALIVAHIGWLQASPYPGEVVSGFGAAMIVMGAWLAAWPFLRRGVNATVQAASPRRGTFLRGTQQIMEDKMRDLIERPRIRREVVAERVVAFWLVVIGTLLNGYGPLIARVLHLRGS